jgi:hypothetical protein
MTHWSTGTFGKTCSIRCAAAGSAAGLAAAQAGREHPRVVEHHEVACPQQRRLVLEHHVAQTTAAGHEQSARRAVIERTLGDQFLRQPIGKIGAAQRRGHQPAGLTPY